MKILQVFNNSVVLARDELGRDVVLTGRGVGFQVRRGQEVDPSRVARVFVPADNPSSVAQLLAEIPTDHLELVAELFTDAVTSLNAPLPPLSIIAAADHIHQALQRVARGEVMEYPMRSEVAHLHPDELRVAEALVDRLNARLDATFRRARRSRWRCTCSMPPPAAPPWSRPSPSRRSSGRSSTWSGSTSARASTPTPSTPPGSPPTCATSSRAPARACSSKGMPPASGRPCTRSTRRPTSSPSASAPCWSCASTTRVSEDEVVYLAMHIARLEHAAGR